MADVKVQSLSVEQKKDIQARLEKKWRTPKECPICHENQWALGDHIVAPPLYSQGNFVIGGAAYPVAMLICENCGYTYFFNAVVLGMIPASGKPETTDAK